MLCHFDHWLFELFAIGHFVPFYAGQNILKTVQAIHLKFLGVLYSY